MAAVKSRKVLPEVTKHVRLELSPEEQANLRVIAAQAGMSMAPYVRMVIQNVIQTELRKTPKGKRT